MKRYTFGVVSGLLTDNESGEIFSHNVEAEGMRWWVNTTALEGQFAKTEPDGRVMRLDVTDTGVAFAGWAKSPKEWKNASAMGKAISPAPGDINRLWPASFHRLDFEGKSYALDTESLEHQITQLPDRRFLTLMLTKDTQRTLPAALVPEAQNYGCAVLWGEQPSTALAAPGSGEDAAAPPMLLSADAPPTKSDLAMLFSTDEKALSREADAPIVNMPIIFWTMGTIDKSNGNITNHPIQGIPLIRFRVPEWFGTPQDDDAEPRERFACFLMTTVPNVLCSTRDEKEMLVPAGTVVWVDVKWDLRSIVRFLPRISGDGDSQRIVQANELKLTPRGKRQFQRKGNDGVPKPASAWRIDMQWVGKYTSQRQLELIAAMMLQCPEVPWRPGDDVIEVQGYPTP